MRSYIWELAEWPTFAWDEATLLPLLSSARLKQGKLVQKIQGLLEPDSRLAEALLYEAETLKTAQIEGEKYNPELVKSSIHRRLGLDYAGLPHTERYIDGLVDVLFDATLHFEEPLTVKRLLGWQAAIFPTGHSSLTKIRTGKFRDDIHGPMEVVSGSIGREIVHFEAPPADKVSSEINRFISWWKDNRSKLDGIIRAGITHFYFVSIHPFDDGNGRIARVLTDMALAQDDKLAKRYYSLSTEILKDKQTYYKILEQSQKGNLNITSWLTWFINCFSKSIDNSEDILRNIFEKADFWHHFQSADINLRQRKVINVLLDAGQGNFIGGLTTRKYVGITKVSRMTAIRDINDLLTKKFLVQNEGKGRNVNYDLNWQRITAKA
jgi:Fic family protein